MARTKATPPQVAARWGISPEKVLVWIHSGELRAIDASTKRGGRPRYLIDEDDLAAFERSRTTIATPPTKPARRRPLPRQAVALVQHEINAIDDIGAELQKQQGKGAAK